MDADPARQEPHMARWNLAGSAGAVAGPFLLIAVLAAGGSWRTAYLALAGCAAACWLGVARNRPLPLPSPVAESPADADPAAAARRVLAALGQPGVIRWLLLLQLAAACPARAASR
jgi:predicted MFS family arabinose efflux permease